MLGRRGAGTIGLIIQLWRRQGGRSELTEGAEQKCNQGKKGLQAAWSQHETGLWSQKCLLCGVSMLCPAERPHSSGTCMCAQSRACLLPSLQVHMRLQSPGHPLSKGWSGSWEQIPALGSLPSFPRAFSYPTPQPCQVLRTSGGSRMRVLCGGHRCLVPSWSAPTIFQG